MTTDRRSALLVAAACAATVVAGLGVAAQHRVNGELGQVIDDGFTAALISFSSGLVLLLVATAASPRARAAFRAIRPLLASGELRWWMLLGGFGGAFLVLGQSLVASILGVAIFTVATVTGQTAMGLWIDATGFAGSRRAPVTTQRLLGTLLTLAAVVVAVAPEIGGRVPVAALLLPLLAGLGVGAQAAVNGRVRTATGSPIAATTINFIIGTTALAVATGVHLLIAGLPDRLPSDPALYIGGALGAGFIAIQTITVARIGVLILGLCLVMGQLVGALVLDLVLPIGVATTASTAIGAALTLVGVLIAAIPSRRRDRPRRASQAGA
ncbi:DMT family transporter [Microcella alkalica]|uniref:Transporter family-2 protein n=2 Tax=Microcella alkalica TaxID=355930 RepID=A0A839E9Y3_9MICO|nr:DMT family transporter [Microcella alkalica]MBA8848056.1 transporter family-2 protein [Microcella alkalica]